MEIWEYCSVRLAIAQRLINATYVAVVTYYTPEEARDEEIEWKGYDTKAQRAEMLGHVFAVLGTDGWELVSTQTSTDGDAYFLKRLVQS